MFNQSHMVFIIPYDATGYYALRWTHGHTHIPTHEPKQFHVHGPAARAHLV